MFTENNYEKNKKLNNIKSREQVKDIRKLYINKLLLCIDLLFLVLDHI